MIERIVLKSQCCMVWAKAMVILVLALVIILAADPGPGGVMYAEGHCQCLSSIHLNSELLAFLPFLCILSLLKKNEI